MCVVIILIIGLTVPIKTHSCTTTISLLSMSSAKRLFCPCDETSRCRYYGAVPLSCRSKIEGPFPTEWEVECDSTEHCNAAFQLLKLNLQRLRKASQQHRRSQLRQFLGSGDWVQFRNHISYTSSIECDEVVYDTLKDFNKLMEALIDSVS